MALQSDVTILNKYRIVKLLGEGGMARVWLAEELTFGKRLVALKEPRPNPLSDDAAEIALRYQREVQVCAELEQAGVPQIVRAITAEPYEDGLLLVMAYMPGGDLASLIKQHPNGLPPERAVAIALDVLDALAGAHSHPLEIVHRDVKPSNILFDKDGRAYLADFGLAQLAGVSGRSQLRGGQHPGTPPYMAPEQERAPGYLSPAADLFALGCVLWEMLTGQRYKRSKPGTASSQLRTDVPAWLDEVVMRALAEDAWERWQSAGEMAQALHAGQAALRQAQEAAEAQRLAEEGARQAAAARRAAEEQALQEAEHRAQVEAAERARREEEERQRQEQLAALFAKAQADVEQIPWRALRLLAQIRASDPHYPGLANLKRRATKVQKTKEREGYYEIPSLGVLGIDYDKIRLYEKRQMRRRATGGIALVLVAITLIWVLRSTIVPGEDATPTPAATSTQAVAQVTATHTAAVRTDTPARPDDTRVAATDAPVPPANTPFPAFQDRNLRYVVKAGDTLFGIALSLSTDVETLRRLNYLSDDRLVVGQLLAVPGYVDHVVQAGENLTSIAAQHGVDWQDVVVANNISGTNYIIYRGQQLRIPGVMPTPVPTPNARRHVIQPGESLSVIASKYEVTLAALMRANGIDNADLIYVGQVLAIPDR